MQESINTVIENITVGKDGKFQIICGDNLRWLEISNVM